MKRRERALLRKGRKEKANLMNVENLTQKQKRRARD